MKTKLQTAWSKAVNNKDNWSYKDGIYGHKVQGLLKADHYMAYNIVRGLPLDRGFTKSEWFENLVDYMTNINKFSGSMLVRYYVKHFDELVTLDEFTEKANEAIRLYRNP